MPELQGRFKPRSINVLRTSSKKAEENKKLSYFYYRFQTSLAGIVRLERILMHYIEGTGPRKPELTFDLLYKSENESDDEGKLPKLSVRVRNDCDTVQKHDRREDLIRSLNELREMINGVKDDDIIRAIENMNAQLWNQIIRLRSSNLETNLYEDQPSKN